MPILDHLIQSEDSAKAFEAFFKKAAIRLLVIAIVLGIAAGLSIYFLIWDLDIYSTALMNGAFYGLALLVLILAPSVLCLVLSVVSFAAAKYIHPKRYELASKNK